MVVLANTFTEEQVEAAARAWMTWQFPGRSWEDAVPAMKEKFRDGARRALMAAVAHDELLRSCSCA